MDLTRITIIAVTLGLTTTLALMSACGKTERPDIVAYETATKEYRTLRGERRDLESLGWNPVERRVGSDGVVRWLVWREKDR